MRFKLPLVRAHLAGRAPIFGYGVAVLSVILALIPALLLSDVVESRLVVFAVAVMVSAWYGGVGRGVLCTHLAFCGRGDFFLKNHRASPRSNKTQQHLTVFLLLRMVDF